MECRLSTAWPGPWSLPTTLVTTVKPSSRLQSGCGTVDQLVCHCQLPPYSFKTHLSSFILPDQRTLSCYYLKLLLTVCCTAFSMHTCLPVARYWSHSNRRRHCNKILVIADGAILSVGLVGNMLVIYVATTYPARSDLTGFPRRSYIHLCNASHFARKHIHELYFGDMGYRQVSNSCCDLYHWFLLSDGPWTTNIEKFST